MAQVTSNKGFEYRISVNCRTTLEAQSYMIGNEVNEIDIEHIFDQDVLDKCAKVNSVDLNEQSENLVSFGNEGHQFVRINAFDDNENYDDYEISVSVEPSAFQEEVDGHFVNQNNGVGIVFGFIDAGNYFKLEWICNEYSCSSEALNELRLVQVEDYQESILTKATLVERPSFRATPAFSEKVHMSVKVNRSRNIIVGITSYAEILCTTVKPPRINEFGLFSWDNEIGLVFDDFAINEYIEK